MFNGISIIFESDGKGKEYDNYNNFVKFEGEYLNGRKWNGKGYNKYNIQMFEIKNGNAHIKENIDFSSELIFEGEYLNGEKNGKGIEYYYGSKIKKFEGEYFNGKEWNGKGYNQNKEIIYEL